MVTLLYSGPEASALFGKTRLAILALLFTHADESFYLREIVRLSGAGLGPVQRELKKLAESRIVTREKRGRQVYYQANREGPIFRDLKSLIIRTAGLADVLKGALLPLGEDIELAFVYGSFASATERKSSDIDVMIVGNVDEMALHRAVRRAEEQLGRAVNYTLMSRDELNRRRSDKGGFVSRVISGPKIRIAGETDEL
jgi:predicted nucleotidyltransferase